MFLFGWNNSYSVGISMIDSQHQQLFDLINQLHTSMVEKKSSEVMSKTLNSLIDYTVKHFAAEEKLLNSHNYADLDKHKVVHQSFTQKIRGLQDEFKSGKPVTIELMSFLQNWLVEHIKGTDMRYATVLKSKGVN